MGFLTPWALLALPLAALPVLLAWHGRRRGEPLRFSSLYLIERARERSARAPTRSRWIVLVRCAVLALLVLAAARPVGPGAGDPALHRPTRAIVAVDVSRSALQRVGDGVAWEAIVTAADAVLADAGPDDRMALASVADGLIGWWEGSPFSWRRRLARLAPPARASDWPVPLDALARRAEPGAETYLVTDGSAGARAPSADPEKQYEIEPSGSPAHRVVRITGAAAEPNRALIGFRRMSPERGAPLGRAWGEGAPEVAEIGRRIGARLVDTAAIGLDGTIGGATWAVADTATFALAAEDPLPADDAWRVAPGLRGGAYRIGRWVPADEPPDPGPLFWETALAASERGPEVRRYATLAGLAEAAPELALLPIRRYAPGQAARLSELTRAGTRLLFVPACPVAACAPPPGWMPPAGPDVPELDYRLAPADRQTTLASRPRGSAAPGLPAPLLERVPIRGSLTPIGEAPAALRWDLRSGRPALHATARVALWLVPLGAPVSRLGRTPLFPLVAEVAIGGWDPRWRAGVSGSTVGEPLPVPAGGATVTGPVGADDPRTWRIRPGEEPPRPARPGFYRVEAPPGVRDTSPAANFIAVHGDPAEGDLTPVPDAAWAAWGRIATTSEAWRAARFPRRRGPDLWPWLVALALAGLLAEAWLTRSRSEA